MVRGSASHQWLGMSCPNTLLLVEVKVHNFILHDHLYIPAAGLVLPFSCVSRFADLCLFVLCKMVHMGGESWCTTKDL